MGKLADVLAHPEELWPLVRMKLAADRAMKLPKDPDLAFCYGMLNSVSRSFAVVIQQLPNPLRDAICVFYLVLRALDTVEDDMALADNAKLPTLRTFHKAIYDRTFNMKCGYGHYVRLMEQFPTVVNVFLGLDPTFQTVIADITKRMGHGMAEFIEREVETCGDFDLYCHYVAGLVGVGLSKLFAASGLESEEFRRRDDLSNDMGLLLQKTNIIRDYLEDIQEEPAPRMFWPREIWGRYSDNLADLQLATHRTPAVQCLNHMISNALRHVPHCVAYLSALRDKDVFRFCAVPQIMALGTLALCYNNGGVFEGVVKMRRGLTAHVFARCDSLSQALEWFRQFLLQLRDKARDEVATFDPTRKVVLDMLEQQLTLIDKTLAKAAPAGGGSSSVAGRFVALLLRLVLVVLLGVYFFAAWGLGPAAGTGQDGSTLTNALLAPLHSAALLATGGSSGATALQRAVSSVLLALALRSAVLCGATRRASAAVAAQR